jgi:glutathione peroxidase
MNPLLMRRQLLVGIALLAVPQIASAAGVPDAAFVFDSIDGGQIGMDDWRGHPVLVANTASLCAFAPQYTDLQALYDTYRGQGLVVLAIPSDDFRQELGSEAEVKDYCAMTFGLDLPMTTITHVTGADAHPFYQWLAETNGFTPGWNFNKVLIGADGTVLGTWGSNPNPMGDAIRTAVEAALAG